MAKITLRLLSQNRPLAVCRLDPGAAIPDWAASADWFVIARTSEELSIVCDQDLVPPDPLLRQERDWRCLRVAGVLDFGQTGVLAALAVPLAEAGVPIFAVSTFDTDSLLVKSQDWETALRALAGAGHTIDPDPDPDLRAPNRSEDDEG